MLPRAIGRGRVLATETCIAAPAIRRHIREHEAHQIQSELQKGRKHHMQTMDSSLLELYLRAEITYDVCVCNARDPQFIRDRTGGRASDYTKELCDPCPSTQHLMSRPEGSRSSTERGAGNGADSQSKSCGAL